MNNLRAFPSTPENDATNRYSDVPNTFKRRLVNDGRSLCPRRYVKALMLLVLLLIQAWRTINVLFTLAYVIINREEAKVRFSSIGHWTLKELDHLKIWSLIAEVIVQMPGAVFIHIYSGHKYLLISVTATSILHMLTPVALGHHTAGLLVVLVAQSVFAAPINIAVMSTWKDWAPPKERSTLMIISLYGIFVGAAATIFYSYLFQYVTLDRSFYLSGIAGIIWVLFWYNTSSDTPQNDPLISEDELIYLESNIPMDVHHGIKLKDVPWTSILTSINVILLCLIYFKVAASIEVIKISGGILKHHLLNRYNPLLFFIIFLSLFAVILPCSGYLADWLIKRFSGRTLLIRKIFLCGGFVLQIFFLFGTLAESYITKAAFYIVAYLFFAMSIPGFITLALDMSPRYLAIIAGIIFTFYSLGTLVIAYFIENVVSLLELETISWFFLFDGILSLLAATLFILVGDVQEQPWSLTLALSPRTNDYRSYPKPENEDDLNLVQEIV